MPEIGDIILIRGGLGYRPAMIEEIGKRTTKISWANGETERVDNKRILVPKNFKDRCWMERILKKEKTYITEKEK